MTLLALIGCAGVKPQAAAPGGDAATPANDAGPVNDAPSPRDLLALPDYGTATERPPPAPGKVYAHSAETLYLLEPISKQVTLVGIFDCIGTATSPGSMVDIAIDRVGTMTGSAGVPVNGALGGALVSIDPNTAHCQILNRSDSLTTSLTYVPIGTLVADREALVGYAEDRYVRIDPATGAMTDIGLLNGPASGGTRWVSSGDIVSIMGGGTYLTVLPQGGAQAGGDRIVEVDPKTGALVRIIGATGSDEVLGLGYWGGIAYGFTRLGRLIQIDLASGAGTDIPIPDIPPDLMFLGAGTTTIAPIFID